jgi:tetratricopeptide (TPR) repeat protein
MKGFGEADTTPESAQTDTPDWLKGVGNEPETTASSDEPDWLKGIGEADITPQPAQTDTPDWLKGVGNEAETTVSSDEPDWLKGITDITPQPAQTDTPDWLKELGNETEPTAAAQANDLDWLKDTGSEPQSAPAVSTDDDSEWLKQFGAQTGPVAPTSEDSKEFDFLNELTQEPVLQSPETDRIDDLGKSAQEQDDSFAWLENLAAKQGATEGLLTKPEERLEDEPEWVKQAKGISSESSAPSQPAANVEELGKSEQEQDDSFAWLESLAAKQGASEGLLTKPEERLEEEPEWVKQAKGLTSEPVSSQAPAPVEELGKSEQERDDSFAWLENLAAKQGATEGLLTKPEERLQEEPEWVKQAKSVPSEPPVTQQPPVTEPAASVEELGKSDQERDDSFAWLEGLAAKQGASEGLLTKPEERLEEEPEWVKQSRPIPSEPPIAQPPAASVEELGKSEQEQDDSFAWLESLAAKQGASEGLLTKPEERLEEEPEWVKQAKDLSAQQTVTSVSQPEPVAEQPATDDTPAWLTDLEKEEQPEPLSIDDAPVWSRGLDQEEKEPEPAADETAIWLRNLDETESASAEAATEPVLEQPSIVDETPAWLKGLDEEEKQPEPAVDDTTMWLKSLDQPEAISVRPADDDMPAWMQNIEQQEAPASEPAVPAEEAVQARESELPSWLSELEKEEASITPPANAEDLPAWLRDDTGELIAEPASIEPTRSTDWKPVDEPRQPEIIYSPPLDEPKEPEIVYSPPLEEVPQPEPEKPLPPVSFEPPQQEPAMPSPPVQEQRKPEPRPVRKAPSRPTPASEPAARPRGTGMLVMPGIDQTLGAARSELSRSNIPGALDSYAKLIKKGRFLDEVIYDLREALYRYPVEVSIWQSLGDAYMRANRLQDALDAYTKAEELLR